MSFKKICRLVLSTVVCFATITSPLANQTIISKLGIDNIDVVSHATGGGGGGIRPIDPNEQEQEDKGVPISDEEKTLPYESDIITNIEYNNEYGFLGVNISPDFLEGKFVN